MAKKEKFSSLINGIIGNDNPSEEPNKNISQTKETVSRGPGRPKNPLTKELARTSFVAEKDLIRKLKFISVASDKLLQDIISQSFKNFISQWEAEHGKIKLP